MKKYDFPKNQTHFFTHNNHFDYPQAHTHSYWEIYIFVEGTATHFINNQKINITPNTLWIIHPEDKHSIVDGSQDLNYINFGISKEIMETFVFSKSRILRKTFQQPLLYFEISTVTASKILSDELSLLQLKKSSDEYQFALYKQFLNILYRIIKHIHSLQPAPKSSLDYHINNVVNQLKDIRNMSRSLTEILKESHYSYSGIAKKFKQQMGVSPSTFFIACKMETAKNLLESSTNSIETIANTIGYDSITCFYNTFKKHYNISPHAYRRQWLKDYNDYEEI